MTLFSHEANVSSGLVDLDRQVRNQSELVSLYGEVAAELIQVLYYRVCDLEGHLIYNSIDEYERDNKIRRLSNHSQSDNGIIDTEKPCSSNVVEPVEPSVEEWRAWQRQMCMIDSNELYAQNGVVIDTSCIGTNPNNYYFLSATEDSLLNIADSEVGISNNNSSRNSNESHPSSRPASMKASAPTTGRVSPVGSHSNIHSPPIALEGFSAHELDALVRCIESVDNRQYVRPHQLPSISTSILSSSAYHDMMPATTIPTFSQQHLQQPQLQKHNLNQHVYNHQQPPLLPAYYQPQQYFPQLQQSQQQQTQYSHHPYVQPQTLAHPNLMMANYSGDVGSRDLFGAAGLETALFAE